MFKHLSIDQLKAQGLSDFTIVDIRDPASFSAGSIPDSQILNNQNIEDFISQADKSKPCVVCCYHGHSSQNVASYLADQGFNMIYSLDGGFQAWDLSL